MEQKEICCQAGRNKKPRGLIPGIIYGLIPHSFCIAFVVFSAVGAVAATAFIKKFMGIPYIFHILVIVSLLLATVSAVLYLKKIGCFCGAGIKRKWRYVATLYSTTILVNVLMFFAIIPAIANMEMQAVSAEKNISNAVLSIDVQIPCSGHAPLIMDEIKKDKGVQSVKYRVPDTFEIIYDPQSTSPEQIISQEIFKTFKATINQQQRSGINN